jgi:hypothetical protein
VARRKMTIRRIDPWSVLKFGFLANLSLLAILLLAAVLVWFGIRQLGLIEQACDMAETIGLQQQQRCGVDGGSLFRILLLLGLLGVVILTGLNVFFAFLHNLIADLVGGISVTVTEVGRGVVVGGGRGRGEQAWETERPRRHEPDRGRPAPAERDESAPTGAVASGDGGGSPRPAPRAAAPRRRSPGPWPWERPETGAGGLPERRAGEHEDAGKEREDRERRERPVSDEELFGARHRGA